MGVKQMRCDEVELIQMVQKSGSVEEYCEYSKDYSGSIKQAGITEKLSYTVPG